MSWDLFIQDLPVSARSVAEIPDDFVPAPLGRREEIIRAILSVFPTAKANAPDGLTIDADDYTIDFGIGSDPVTCIALHVRGRDSVIPHFATLLEQLGGEDHD